VAEATSIPAGLLLSDDLIFTSRIAGVARSRGISLIAAKNAAALLELAQRSVPRCVIVDLDNPKLDLAGLLESLRGVTPRPRIVAYGPHVNAELLHSARTSGCDIVLPRSKFVESLETELPNWFGLGSD
jgi:DNA-binding NarL/FixJ family response regulator